MTPGRSICMALALAAAPLSATEPTALELSWERALPGLQISWDALLGADYVLEASEDFLLWQQVGQNVVQEEGTRRVFVSVDSSKNFYRLINDGVSRQAAYVGSATCRNCHTTHYDRFVLSGHPYSLNRVAGGRPIYPLSAVPNPPPDYAWTNLAWVIGGATAKAQFIDSQGYIVTGTNTQWNLATESWVPLNPEHPPGSQPYDCGACHTTGWISLTEGSVHQDGQAGMLGSFAAPGVQCEACHGPGSQHVLSQKKEDILTDRSSEFCANCHSRGLVDTIPASDGFIQNYAQYNELFSTQHHFLSCNDCHDPHVSVRYEPTSALVQDCTACHLPSKYAIDFHSAFATCTDCHMPKVTRSAQATNKYTADLKTHIFKINVAADGQMFSPDGLSANGSTGVTLAHACYACHRDPDGVGGKSSIQTLQQLSTRAQVFHGP